MLISLSKTFCDGEVCVYMKKEATNCENCMYYEYDYDDEEYYCSQSCLDEDDIAKMAMDSHYHCPYYREGNEYTIVRKQI